MISVTGLKERLVILRDMNGLKNIMSTRTYAIAIRDAILIQNLDRFMAAAKSSSWKETLVQSVITL